MIINNLDKYYEPANILSINPTANSPNQKKENKGYGEENKLMERQFDISHNQEE